MNARPEAITAVLPVRKDAHSFIEMQFPVSRISAETYKERKAGSGQTLTSLGSYWKGRKPLVLVRAALLGCLLPATGDPLADLRVFLLLMGIDDASIRRRLGTIGAKDVDPTWERYLEIVDPDPEPAWRREVAKEDRDDLLAEWLNTLPYDRRIQHCLRPEERFAALHAGIWPEVNAHLGTSARSFPELIEQLGIMRFGKRPRVADTFAGGGSIPFEAARMGCDVYASDLNPIACMLTWGTFNIVGAGPAERADMDDRLRSLSSDIEAYFSDLEIEDDGEGNKAKSFLYCLEVRCPKTGWMVPVVQSWVISTKQNVIGRLRPDHENRRYEVEILTGVTLAEAEAAKSGTLVGGRLVHPMNPDRDGVALELIRGDHRNAEREPANRLRRWTKTDFRPAPDDIFQERLYCIQWITKETLSKRRQDTYFAAPTEDDLERERKVESIIAENLREWQDQGHVPDMAIEPGEKTDEPIRTRGWTYWHHLFAPRQLLLLAKINMLSETPLERIIFSNELNFHSKLCGINPRTRGSGREMCLDRVFINQALNTLINYGVRSSFYRADNSERISAFEMPAIDFKVRTHSAASMDREVDVFVTDPPYADAVNYHEITEYFIAWLRKRLPEEFGSWVWNSQRPRAIQGSDEKFRSDMVSAYKNMAACMPDNGMQVVMFTHQDAGVWADLASIMWTAGLRVTAAWNVKTEVEKPSGEGNYVQGTILLVLRKRLSAANIKRMDIEGEIEEEVDRQLATLHAIDDGWTSEVLYTDGDLQLAAYGAALRVITNYATIDRKEVGADVYRKMAKGERTVIRELIEYAASVANNKLVPEGFPAAMWRDLDPGSRFYVRMLDMESKGATRYADYSDFAKTFSFQDYSDLLHSTKANAVSLAGADVLKGRFLGTKGFGSSPLRRVLFAIFKTMQKENPHEGIAFLKTEFGQDYWSMRLKLVEFAKYVALKTSKTRPIESSSADLLAQRIEVDRI